VVGVRADHPLADRDGVRLADLDGETLGILSEQLFPAWSVALRQVLQDAGVSPRTVELADTDLSACRWPMQAEVDWILTTRGVSGADATTPLIPASPAQFVPYTLRWCPIRGAAAAVGRPGGAHCEGSDRLDRAAGPSLTRGPIVDLDEGGRCLEVRLRVVLSRAEERTHRCRMNCKVERSPSSLPMVSRRSNWNSPVPR